MPGIKGLPGLTLSPPAPWMDTSLQSVAHEHANLWHAGEEGGSVEMRIYPRYVPRNICISESKNQGKLNKLKVRMPWIAR